MGVGTHFDQGLEGQCNICIERWVVMCVHLACGVVPSDVQVLYSINHLLYGMLLGPEVPLSLKVSKLILCDVYGNATIMCGNIDAVQPHNATLGWEASLGQHGTLASL